MKNLLIPCSAALFLLCAFTVTKKNKLKLPEEFTWIPAGTWNDKPGDGTMEAGILVSTRGFYMSKSEVSNGQYRQFIAEVLPGSTAEEKEKIVCDTAGWSRVMSYCEPMKTYYYSHPAYNNYPVVNISYEGAVKYCEWLQQKIQKENPGFIVEVKLPTRQEWIWAAMGGRSQAMFPWSNYYLLNKKGEPMCNFKRISDGAIYRNRITGKPEVAENPGIYSQTAYITSHVKSFYPNDYGLYNMCGNAAEMINENGIAMGGSWNDYGGDINTRAESTYKGSTPTVGFRPIIKVNENKTGN